MIETENTLYLGPAASIQSYSDGTTTATFPSKTTITVDKTPVNDLDAVNKIYVDTILSTIVRINNLNNLLVACDLI